MADNMMFPSEWEKFIENYSFNDKEKVYTNGARLILTFRVGQMVEHYFGSKWIPVSERLPKHGEIVVCYLKWKDTRILQRDNYNDMWFGYGRGDDWKGENVTHWMPLPTPPKE
jgi:hypothetical protein